MSTATETRPQAAPGQDQPTPRRNVKRILGYVGAGVLGLAIGSAAGGDTPDPEVVERIARVNPSAERIAALDAREADLDARTAQLDSETDALIARDVAVSAEEQARNGGTFEDGVYQVGVEIQPGTYATAGGGGGDCYWEKSTGGVGNGSIVDNDTQAGPVVLVIEPSVTFFKSNGCGTWTKR